MEKLKPEVPIHVSQLQIVIQSISLLADLARKLSKISWLRRRRHGHWCRKLFYAKKFKQNSKIHVWDHIPKWVYRMSESPYEWASKTFLLLCREIINIEGFLQGMQEAGTLFLLKNKCLCFCGPPELKKHTPYSYISSLTPYWIQLKSREGSLETE